MKEPFQDSMATSEDLKRLRNCKFYSSETGIKQVFNFPNREKIFRLCKVKKKM